MSMLVLLNNPADAAPNNALINMTTAMMMRMKFMNTPSLPRP